MRTTEISQKEREKAFASARKPESIEKQKLDVRYHIEDFEVNDRPQRFLEAFAAILKHSNYKMALDHFIRMSAKCSRCATTCQVYQATGDPKDIPCYRTELLLSVYRRHFTMGVMLNAPVPAARKVLAKAGMTLDDIDLFEVNEAFAVVSEKFQRDLDLDRAKVNVNGGAMALGHPIGATGSILIGTVLDELERRDEQVGLITMCAGGGMAPAIIIERV